MNTSRYLASNRNSAMPITKMVTAYDNIFGGNADPPTVLIAAGFDCNAVIACLEIAIFDQDIARTFGIDAVIRDRLLIARVKRGSGSTFGCN